MNRRTILALIGSTVLLPGVVSGSPRLPVRTRCFRATTTTNLVHRVLGVLREGTVVTSLEDPKKRTVGFSTVFTGLTQEERYNFILPISTAGWLSPWPETDRQTLQSFPRINRAFWGPTGRAEIAEVLTQGARSWFELETALAEAV
jgi:hypothetical protein